VSAIGDQLFPVAVTVQVLDHGGTVGDLGLVLAARTAALVLFALLGGVWADRLPRVRVLIGADALRLVAVLGLVLVVSGTTSVLLLAALVFFVGAGEAFFRPAFGALIPSVLPQEQLNAGNALSGSTFHMSAIVGPGLAGVLVALSGPRGALLVDAATFAFSLAGLIGVGKQEAFQLLWNASAIFYALTYLVMFAIPLIGRRGAAPPPGVVRVAAVSGFLMTGLYVALSIAPIVQVESRLAFALKIASVVVVTNLIGLLIFRRSQNPAPAESGHDRL
jgi:MFS family permease